MSDQEQNPTNHQSPVHDASESKPGLDSLAPADGFIALPRISPRPASNPRPRQFKTLQHVIRNSPRWKPFVRAAKIFRDDKPGRTHRRRSKFMRAGTRGPTLPGRLYSARKDHPF